MMGGLGMGFGFIFWIVIVLFGVWLLKYIVDQNRQQSTNSIKKSAVDILQERYARGEINKIQFDEMKRELLK